MAERARTMGQRPKDMTADERNSLPLRDQPTTDRLFAIYDGDILAIRNENGQTYGLAQDPDDQSWFRYRII